MVTTLKRNQKIFRLKFIRKDGSKIDKLIVTSAPENIVSRTINNSFKIGEPKTGRFTLSRIKEKTAKNLLKSSKTKRRDRPRKLMFGRFKGKIGRI